MMIRIKNIKLLTTVGVTEEERKAPRPLVVSLAIDYNHDKAVETDSIDNTVDYALIENAIVADLANRSFNLIESIAEHICQMMFGNELVREVVVEVEKPGAMRFAESVSVVHSLVRG